MTLIVSVKVPCRALNPYRRPLEFPEPGIILAADSRYSYEEKPPDDYGTKIWKLSSWALAGFSGYSVELVEKSLTGTKRALEEHYFTEPYKVAHAAEKYLLYYDDDYRKRGFNDKKCRTDVLLALYDATDGRFYVYRLSSSEKFRPMLREGVVPIGRGSRKFSDIFKKEIDHYTKQESAPAKLNFKFVQGDDGVLVVPRSPNEPIPLSLWSLHGFVLSTVDLFIEKAKEPTVGGFVASASLSCQGIYAKMHAKKRVKGKWCDVTSSKLKPFCTIWGKKYRIPRMRSDFSIGD